MKKRLSILLSIVILFSVMTVIPMEVSAKEADLAETGTSKSQADALAWVASKNGQALDYDGQYGAQCVDFIYYYYVYLEGYAVGGNAKDYTWNSLPAGWYRTSSPSPGDIVVWGAGGYLGKPGYYADSSFGHIGIVTAVNGGTIDYYDQNAYPQGQKVGYHSGHDASSAATYIHPNFASDIDAYLPYGYLDSVTVSGNKVTVKGWAYDKDCPATSIDVHVYVGNECHIISANKNLDPGVTKYTGYSNHCFQDSFYTSKTGTQTVIAYGINYNKHSSVTYTRNTPLINQHTISIPVQTAASSIKLSKTSVSLKYGKTYTLKATVTPSNATNKTVTWSTSNKAVATVSKNGVVTAKGAGTATITAKTANGKTAVCKVKVTLATPSLPTLKNTKNGVQISWKRVPGAAKYRIFRKTGNGKWKKIADTNKAYVDKSAKNGVTYTYTIRCISKNGKHFTSSYNKTGKSIKCKR